MSVSCRTRRKVGDFGNDAWNKAFLRVGEMSGGQFWLLLTPLINAVHCSYLHSETTYPFFFIRGSTNSSILGIYLLE